MEKSKEQLAADLVEANNDYFTPRDPGLSFAQTH